MSAAARERHERILHEGLALVSQEGLQGVTLGVLATRVGMSKSGLFAHFRSKEEVQIELLKYMNSFGAKYVLEPALAAEEGLPRLRAMVEHWLGWSARAGLPGGCPVAAALFELDDLEGPVRDQVVIMERESRDLLAGLVTRAMQLGHLRDDVDAEQFVWELFGIYLSHHVAHRFLRSADARTRALTAFEALIARGLPDKTAKGRSRR